MLFSSHIFILAFLPLALGAYYFLAGRQRARQWLLVLASLMFYGWWDVRLLPLLVGSIAVNWLLVQAFGRSRRRVLMTLGVVLNLTLIGIFKYADFFAGSLLPLVGQEHRSFDIILPLGISFFTFQQISYLVDLSRGEKAVYDFRRYLLFVTFFPQLIAGPIVRHDEIISQFDLDPLREGLWERLSKGAVFFVFGLAKKVWLADQIAAIADPLYQRSFLGESLTLAESWLCAAGFATQVYFDFSGYSDMAIGLGLLCGFMLPLNFNAPFQATDIRDFWRRWHMTLSRFLRDYLYFPLGGARCSKPRQAFNVMVTMLLCGLWHGAGWGYVLWGGCTGVGLIVHSVWRRYASMPALPGWFLTLMFFYVTMVPFRAQSGESGVSLLASMFGAHGLGTLDLGDLWPLWIGMVVSVVGPTSQQLVLQRLRPRRWIPVAVGTALALVVFWIGGAVQNEFVYFQF